jgi:hypothetical protein
VEPLDEPVEDDPDDGADAPPEPVCLWCECPPLDVFLAFEVAVEPAVEVVDDVAVATAAVVFAGASAPTAAVLPVVFRLLLLPHAPSAAPASSTVAPPPRRLQTPGCDRRRLMARPVPPLPPRDPLAAAHRYRNSAP